MDEQDKIDFDIFKLKYMKVGLYTFRKLFDNACKEKNIEFIGVDEVIKSLEACIEEMDISIKNNKGKE